MSCKRRLYYLRKKRQLPGDLTHAVKPAPIRDPDLPVGVTFVQNSTAAATPGTTSPDASAPLRTDESSSSEHDVPSGSWVAKCTIAGRTIKRCFSVRAYGFDGAREQAILARQAMLEEREQYIATDVPSTSTSTL